MLNLKGIFGKSYTIVPCTLDDIEPHFAKIQDTIESHTVAEFKQKMTDAVNDESAFMLSDNSCYLYYLNYAPRCAMGIALYGKGVPNEMLSLFYGIFKGIDTHTLKIDFHMHAGKTVSEYKSIVTEASIRRQIIPGQPLVVKVDQLLGKLSTIYEKRGVVWDG